MSRSLLFRPSARTRSRRRIPTRCWKPILERLEDRSLPSATLQVSGNYTIDSYAGVGFEENEVGTLAASLNGQPDTTKSDFQTQVQWGDGGTSNGDLVFLGISGSFADYMIKGTHTYTQINSNVPINVTVTGPSGSNASARTAYAGVAPMPSGIAGTPPPSSAGTSQPANVAIRVSGSYSVNAQAGLSSGNVQVATVSLEMNGQPDQTLADVQGQINWGDSASWSTANLTLVRISGSFAQYNVYGSNTYNQAATNVPIVVYVNGPDGTSASARTAYATIAQSTVTPVPLLKGEASFSVDQGQTLNNTPLASFQDAAPPPGLKAEIDYGDNTPPVPGNIIPAGGPNFTIQPDEPHTYQNSGPYQITITLSDSRGDKSIITDQVTVNAPVTLGPLNPTQWTTNEPNYQGTILISGGSDVYSHLSITGLPTGLSAGLAGSTISVTGIPTQSGTFPLTVSVQDSNGATGAGNYSLTISPALALGGLDQTQWPVLRPGYSGQISVSGGSGSYANLSVSGLPSGLSPALSGNTIVISGTPFTLQVSIADSAGATAVGTDSLTINPAILTFGTLTPGQWQLNQAGYNGVISINGGSGSYSNLKVSGLPAGLTPALNGNFIGITGTPTTAGTFSIGLSVEDANGSGSGTGTAALTITAGSVLTLGNLTPTQWTVNTPRYLGSIAVSGGSGLYRGLQVNGLPAGLTAALSAHTIFIRGTPTQQGTFRNIAVALQDSKGELGSGTYSLTINPPIKLGTGSHAVGRESARL